MTTRNVRLREEVLEQGSGDEEKLAGGRTTAGVVRVGNTVRRPPTRNSDFVHRLLSHMAARGFDGVPRSLGRDRGGRDVLSFVEGDVPIELGFFDDEALRGAACLIRRFHDLAAELIAAPAARAVGIDTVCHNDLSPCNFVFRNGLPIAMIDFDVAAPGIRVHDLGYAAWLWLDLGNPEITPFDQARRLAVFVEAYGASDADAVLTAALHRQGVLIAEGRRRGDPAMTRWATGCRDWTRSHLHLLG